MDIKILGGHHSEKPVWELGRALSLRLTVSFWLQALPCSKQPLIWIYQVPVHLSRDSKSWWLTFSASVCSVLSHRLDLNGAYQIRTVSHQNTEGTITFSHFYEFFILFQQRQNRIMWVKSQSLWVWTEGRKNVFQLPFAIQLQPPWEPWAAFTPHTLLSSEHQENRAASCNALCQELYSFLRP